MSIATIVCVCTRVVKIAKSPCFCINYVGYLNIALILQSSLSINQLGPFYKAQVCGTFISSKCQVAILLGVFWHILLLGTPFRHELHMLGSMRAVCVPPHPGPQSQLIEILQNLDCGLWTGPWTGILTTLTRFLGCQTQASNLGGHIRPVHRGGSRGFGRTPLFWPPSMY